MVNETIILSVICHNPLSGDFGLQDKNRDLIDGEQLPDGSLRFSCELNVKQADDGRPNFTGAFAHGSPKERFLYLTLRTLEDSEWRIIKRIKVHLKTITWEQVEAALSQPGAFLIAEVDGRGSASVPLLGEGWQVSNSV